MKIAFVAALVWAASPLQAEDIAAGRILYAENCASCHGVRLEGEPNWQSRKPDGTMPAPPHDASGHTWHHGDKLLFNYTKLGGAAMMAQRGLSGFQSGMPGFGESLSDQQILDVLAFIKSTWPRKVKEVQAERSAAEP